MIPWVGVLVLKWGHISHLVKCIVSFPLLVYTGVWSRQIKYIVIVLSDISYFAKNKIYQIGHFWQEISVKSLILKGLTASCS